MPAPAARSGRKHGTTSDAAVNQFLRRNWLFTGASTNRNPKSPTNSA